jgi:hypothetical protein
MATDFDTVPVFEIQSGERRYAIYVSGRVDGFEGDVPMTITNRIADWLAQEIEIVLNQRK